MTKRWKIRRKCIEMQHTVFTALPRRKRYRTEFRCNVLENAYNFSADARNYAFRITVPQSDEKRTANDRTKDLFPTFPTFDALSHIEPCDDVACVPGHKRVHRVCAIIQPLKCVELYIVLLTTDTCSAPYHIENDVSRNGTTRI